jgi:hypothetical protein
MRLRSWLAAAGALTVGITGAMSVITLNASAATNTIEDTSSAVSWSGTWTQCSSNCNKASDNSFRWTKTTNSSVTITFTGSQIALWGMKEPWSNIATASIDGGTAVNVDFFAAQASATSVQVWSSPTLADTNHTLKLTWTSARNPAGDTSNASITFDKAVVTTGTGPSNPPSSSSPPPSNPPTGTRLSGLPWNSGVNPQPQTWERVKQFESFRGARVDNITLFPPRDTWSTLSDPAWIEAGTGPTCNASNLPASCFNPSKQDLIMTIPLWPGSSGNSVSNTGSQAQWQNFANVVKAKDPNAYIRLGWEMNLPNWHWNLNSGNRTQWQASFIQAVQWMKAVAPQLRIVYNPNKWWDQTSGCSNATGCSRPVFVAVRNYVDVYGVDSYDSYPPANTTDNRNFHLNNYLGAELTLAKNNGKKFAVPEWGVACNVTNTTPRCQWAGNAGGDNPLYIQDYMGFFYSHAADMAFDSYFDEPSNYIRSALSVTPIGPNAPARYKQLVTQYKS